MFQKALEILRHLESTKGSTLCTDYGEILNEQGKLLFALSEYHDAIDCFVRAPEFAKDHDAWVKYHVNAAAAYRQLAEVDTAFRYLNQLQPDIGGMSPQIKGHFLLNLSAMQGMMGLYHQVITTIDESLHCLSEASIHAYDAVLYNNRGLAYLGIGDYDQAESCLSRALELDPTRSLHTLSELGRLHLLRGNLTQSMQYSERALSRVWESIVNFEKEEIASLCRSLAQISVQVDDQKLALQLAEKAQVYYGQLGLWQEWSDIDEEVFRWSARPVLTQGEPSRSGTEEIRRFLRWLNAMNSQELIHSKISKLLDIRVHYVKLFAEFLHLNESQQTDLILASRFADYGLTALEHDVVVEPSRSPQAMEQYRLHPMLSLQLMRTLNMSPSVMDIVIDHHEYYDGSGYPKGKSSMEIHPLARVFAVVDRYATGIAVEGKSHSIVISDIASNEKTRFDPQVTNAFVQMFE